MNESQTDLQSNKDDTEFIGSEYIEIFYEGKNRPKFYHCKICDCEIGDLAAKNAHLKGKRHRTSYQVKKFLFVNHSKNCTFRIKLM